MADAQKPSLTVESENVLDNRVTTGQCAQKKATIVKDQQQQKLVDIPQQNKGTNNLKMPPHMRRHLKVSSPSDVLSPLSQRLMSKTEHTHHHLIQPRQLTPLLEEETNRQAGSSSTRNPGPSSGSINRMHQSVTHQQQAIDQEVEEVEIPHSPTKHKF